MAEVESMQEIAADNTPIKKARKHPRIAVFVSFSGTGGVERMILNLVRGLAEHGCYVDLLLVKSHGIALPDMSPRISVIKLRARHTLSCLPALVRYLRKKQPHGLLAAKDRANQVATAAKMLSGFRRRLVVRLGTTVSAALAGQGPIKKGLWYLPMRWMYRRADRVVAVSEGVREDLIRIAGLEPDRVVVIPNPVVSAEIHEMARSPAPHPWLSAGDVPVIMGAGRLTRQKDFPTLIQAFAGLAASRAVRLIILGEGRDRPHLLALTEKLGVRQLVDFAGYVANPYAFLARSSLFVLSSRWEGSPNVLTESLALGVPVVATDCPSGPREILQNGRYGPLVAVGDAAGLEAAMRRTLADPPDSDFLKTAVHEYTVEASSRRYLQTLLAEEPQEDTED